VIVGFVELSGEQPQLAARELEGAVRSLGGAVEETSALEGARLVPVRVVDEGSLHDLSARLALARRTLVPVEGAEDVERAAEREGRRGRSAAFRRVARPGGAADAAVRAAGAAYVRGGGSIDLDAPAVRYWIASAAGRPDALLREVAPVDRGRYAARAMPRLPFRRPVSLPPRLARAAVNLSAVGPGAKVLDPFLGTGALLAEAALVGARVYGIDADAAMVRGSLANLAHLGVRAEAIVEGDARAVDLAGAGPFDAIVTDPPYGRSSVSVGDAPERLVGQVLGRWQDAVRPDGAVVVVVPGGPPALGPPWREECRVPVRVHRSLTREFRRYRRR
jgi:tRNA (guanine10-N2)-dimethyltransferase